MPYGVPITLQTFAILLAGIVLGPRTGMLSAELYVLLGAVGVPVFAGFRGGVAVLLGPTAGFILSFPVLALAAGIGADRGNRASLGVGLAAGSIVNYLCGMIVFSLVTAKDLDTAFLACVFPFIPTDALKTAAAGMLGVKLKNILGKGASTRPSSK